ncbi:MULTISPECIES: hypothetical protein [unclassified Streptomyces]|uniref:hypothetical protein n=1 Tax=unclassified Streptomyces TaxID=2593676 RepID=UPI0008DC7B31|nr:MULTISPECIES: hypothetical protein [unclassified Streptomyces]OII69536.1 hypothetical protein BJP39_17260 [Streptomyces sp. CC77]
MTLRTTALAAISLLTGAAAATAAAPAYAAPAESGDTVALVQKDTVTPWSVVDFALDGLSEND